MAFTLDRIDRRIARELDGNSRRPISELARRLKLGRDIVEYRIDRLKSEGVIRRFVAAINPYSLGLTIYKTYFRLEVRPDSSQSLFAKLKKYPNIIWLAESDGAWDFMVGVIARSPSDYYSIQARLFAQLGSSVMASETSTVVETSIYQRMFGLEKLETGKMSLATTASEYALESFENRLLSALADDARLPVSTLAERLNSTPDIVRHRLQRLETAGVISGYRLDIGLQELGLVFVKAMIQLREWSLAELLRLESFCAQSHKVIYFIRQVGSFAVELELEVESYVTYYRFLDEMKRKFPRMVGFTETVFLRDENYHWVLPA